MIMNYSQLVSSDISITIIEIHNWNASIQLIEIVIGIEIFREL